MATSIWFYPALILLVSWFAYLFKVFWHLLRAPKPETGPYEALRWQLTVAGMGFATVALGALLLLTLSWNFVGGSHRLGSAVPRILSLLLVFPSLLGFLFSSLGSGRIRFLGVGTCFFTGVLWFGLAAGL
jgi:hypothetical protein